MGDWLRGRGNKEASKIQGKKGGMLLLKNSCWVRRWGRRRAQEISGRKTLEKSLAANIGEG